MYHSIKFIREEDIDNLGEQGDINPFIKDTYSDWYLVPTTRPSVNPPQNKTNFIDIPGADSQLDFSTVLTGYPVYNDREGSWTFMLEHDICHREWNDIYSEIMDWIQGERMCCILEDDQSWYYTGRFYVSDLKSEQKYTTITITYKLEPYKKPSFIFMTDVKSDWIWDYFDFEEGILTFDIVEGITVDSDEYVDVIFRQLKTMDEWYYCFGRQPVIPTIIITNEDQNGIDIKFKNNSLNKPEVITNLPAGKTKIRNIIFGGRCLTKFCPKYYPGTDWLMGDINGDGKITSTDASLLLVYATNPANPDIQQYVDRIPKVGDINRDGKINSTDASLILSKFISDDQTYGSPTYIIDQDKSLRLQVKGHGTITFRFVQGRL